MFGVGEVARLGAHEFADVRLEVDRDEIGVAADAVFLEVLHDGVAVGLREFVGKSDDVDEPACGFGFGHGRQVDFRDVGQGAIVEAGGAAAQVEDFVEAFHLRFAQRGAEFVDAVVEPHPRMGEPCGRVAALVSHGAGEVGQVVVVGDDHAALAGGDLLVGVEGEHAAVAEVAGGPAAEVPAQGLAAILDHGQLVRAGNPLVAVEVGRVPEHLHGQNGLRPRRDGRLQGLRIGVVGFGVDVHKDRPGPLEEQAVGRSDKGEWRGDDLVPLADAQGPDAQVQAAGAAVDADAEPPPRAAGAGGLEGLGARADAQAVALEHRDDGLDFIVGDIGL